MYVMYELWSWLVAHVLELVIAYLLFTITLGVRTVWRELEHVNKQLDWVRQYVQRKDIEKQDQLDYEAELSGIRKEYTAKTGESK